MKRMRPFLVIGVLGVIAAVWWFRGRSEASTDVVASGTVEATEAHLGFQAAGRIAEMLVEEGDHVPAGQVLARIDLAEQEALQAGAEANLAAARARLREMERGPRSQESAQAEAVALAARERAAEAERELARAARLHDGGAISRQALDGATTAAEVAGAASNQAAEALALVREGPSREQLDAQRAMVKSAEAALARAAAAVSFGTITAPFPGRVTVTHRETGESVAPGSPVVTLQNPDDRWVRIYVREDRIGGVQLGQRATIRSDTYPDRSHAGQVVFIGSEAEFTPRNTQTTAERVKLVYPVKVRILDDAGFELKPGVPADVELDSEARPQSTGSASASASTSASAAAAGSP